MYYSEVYILICRRFTLFHISPFLNTELLSESPFMRYCIYIFRRVYRLHKLIMDYIYLIFPYLFCISYSICNIFQCNYSRITNSFILQDRYSKELFHFVIIKGRVQLTYTLSTISMDAIQLHNSIDTGSGLDALDDNSCRLLSENIFF